jgi:hypothetical protein
VEVLSLSSMGNRYRPQILVRSLFLNMRIIPKCSVPPRLRTTGFTECFVRKNVLKEKGFKEWVFCSGMLFHARDKWWGHQGKRDRPHEGLDLCLFRDRRDKIFSLHGKMKIPAMYDGKIVRMINDFLGQSVMIEHGFGNDDKSRFYTIYGHTNPRDGLQVGRLVRQGDVIASLVDPAKSKAGLLPHLHLSLGWASEAVTYDKLDWETIGELKTLVLLDPLQIIDSYYVILDHGSPPCRGMRSNRVV